MKKIVFILLFFIGFGILCMNDREAQAKIKKVTPGASTVKLGVGETKKIKVTVKPKKDKKKIKFSSCNKKIATVTKKGTVKGKKKGATHIYIRATDGSKKKAKIKIQVVQKVKSVSFINNLGDNTYEPNTTFLIQAAVLPKTASNKKLKWSSSSSKIASVTSSGVVTTKSKGTTTITAQATDGSKKKVSCKLKVVVPVTSIKLAGGTETLRVQNGKSTKITAEVLPSNASDKSLTWSSSNNMIATVSSNGTVSGMQPGTATIMATSKDGTNIMAMLQVQVISMNTSDTNFIAHRGFSSAAPENSMAAFQLASEAGYWGVECDIWETTDGEFVISHDESLLRMCGVDKKITEMTLEEAMSYTMVNGKNREEYPNEKVVSLRQYLECIRSNRNLHAIIELKMKTLSEESAKKLLDMLAEYSASYRATIISFSKDCLEAMKLADVSELLQYQFISYTADTDTIDYCIENEFGLTCKYTGLTKTAIDELHKNKLDVGVWTVDDFYKAYEFAVDFGVDYVTSNVKHFEY